MHVCAGLIRYLPPRQNKTGVNLLTTSANLTTQKVGVLVWVGVRGGGVRQRELVCVQAGRACCMCSSI